MKVCSKCKENKPLECFCKDKSKPDGLYSSCKSCQRDYRQKNRENISATQKDWLSRNRESQNEYLRNWRVENPNYSKDYYQENKEREKAYSRKWREENPEKVFNYFMKRRASEDIEEISKDLWLKVMNLNNWRCFYCDEELLKSNRTIDHVVPISRGGRNQEQNLIPCCLSCNCSKKDTPVSKWYKFSELTKIKQDRLIQIEMAFQNRK